jgi:hypothetical protein
MDGCLRRGGETWEGHGFAGVGLAGNIYARSSMVHNGRCSEGYPATAGGGLGGREVLER